MSNMSYCRFQNTLSDLRDCEDYIFDKLDEDEHEARVQLVKVCRRIAEGYEDDAQVEEDLKDYLEGDEE